MERSVTMIDVGTYQWLKIEPVDAWFFRDGRPSNRGEDQSDLESEFPPHATTVVGALRAALARQQGWNTPSAWDSELSAVLGDGFDNLGSLSFLGPLLLQTKDGVQELLFPMPRHVVGYPTENGFQPFALLTPSRERVMTDCGEVHLPALPDGWQDRRAEHSDLSEAQKKKLPEPAEGLFVTAGGMTRILRGDVPEAADCRRRSDLFAHEGRVGIRRDPETGTTGQGDIYSPRYVRLKPDVSLVMAVAGVPDSWTFPSLMPLGGESRLAGVEVLDKENAPSLPHAAASSGRAAVISVTPSRFTEPWWGSGSDDPASGLAPQLSGRVLTAALNRPQYIGGWDFRKGPRPLVPFAPAGTVWWLEDTQSAAGGIIQLGDIIQTRYGHGMAFVTETT